MTGKSVVVYICSLLMVVFMVGCDWGPPAKRTDTVNTDNISLDNNVDPGVFEQAKKPAIDPSITEKNLACSTVEVLAECYDGGILHPCRRGDVVDQYLQQTIYLKGTADRNDEVCVISAPVSLYTITENEYAEKFPTHVGPITIDDICSTQNLKLTITNVTEALPFRNPVTSSLKPKLVGGTLSSAECKFLVSMDVVK
jgi:hypothetical protein